MAARSYSFATITSDTTGVSSHIHQAAGGMAGDDARFAMTPGDFAMAPGGFANDRARLPSSTSRSADDSGYFCKKTRQRINHLIKASPQATVLVICTFVFEGLNLLPETPSSTDTYFDRHFFKRFKGACFFFAASASTAGWPHISLVFPSFWARVQMDLDASGLI